MQMQESHNRRKCTRAGNRRRGAEMSKHSIHCGQERHGVEHLVAKPRPSHSCRPPDPARGRPRLRRSHHRLFSPSPSSQASAHPLHPVLAVYKLRAMSTPELFTPETNTASRRRSNTTPAPHLHPALKRMLFQPDPSTTITHLPE